MEDFINIVKKMITILLLVAFICSSLRIFSGIHPQSQENIATPKLIQYGIAEKPEKKATEIVGKYWSDTKTENTGTN